MSNEISVLRKVTVYNTSAQNNRVIDSSAMTWGDLQQELERAGIPYSGMRAVIGENQNELVTGQSHLMQGDMTLFLMPRRVKSGVNGLSRLVNSGGIRYHEKNWNLEDEFPENEDFITEYDLGMALQLKAQYYAKLAVFHLQQAEGLIRSGEGVEGTTNREELVLLGDEEDEEEEDDYEDDYEDEDDEQQEEVAGEDWGFQTVKPVDPVTAKLREQAALIERNMQG